jgi:hypothetical protein
LNTHQIYQLVTFVPFEDATFRRVLLFSTQSVHDIRGIVVLCFDDCSPLLPHLSLEHFYSIIDGKAAERRGGFETKFVSMVELTYGDREIRRRL